MSATAATRALYPFAIARSLTDEVGLVYTTKTLNDDGSFTLAQLPEWKMARVVDLTTSQIQRLQDKGVTIQHGVSVSFPCELDNSPDAISYGPDLLKVVEYTISEGCSVLTLDKAPIGTAVADTRAQ